LSAAVPPGIALDLDGALHRGGAIVIQPDLTARYRASGAVGAPSAVSGGMEPRTQTCDASEGPCLRTYLPLIQGDTDPNLYDDFEDPAHDGAFNPLLWHFGADSAGPGNIFHAGQQDGEMVLTNTLASQPRAAGLGVSVPGPRTLPEIEVFEARLKLGGERAGGWSETSLMVISGNVAGHGWLVQCGMGGRPAEPQATPFCNVSTNQSSPDWPPEYLVYDPFRIPYDTWHTFRIELDPFTAGLRFFLDDELFGSYIPMDAAELCTVEDFQPMVHVWAGDAGTTATHWADEVRITPAK
jgi:hypothetical protein